MKASDSNTTPHRYDTRNPKRGPSTESPGSRKKVNTNDFDIHTRIDEQNNKLTRPVAGIRPREQQQHENIGYFGWFWSLLRGGKTPPKEMVLAMQEQVETKMAELESENEALTQELNSFERRLRNKIQQLEKEQQVEVAKHTSRIAQLQEQHQQAHAQAQAMFHELRSERDSSHEDAAKLHNKLQAAEVQAKGLAKQNEDLQSSLKQTDPKVKSGRKYEDEIAVLQNTIKSLQTARLQSVESARWAPVAVSAIEHQLSAILSEVRKWSQKHVEWTIDQVLEAKRFECLAATLLKWGCIMSPNQLYSGLADCDAMQKKGKAGALLMGAIVTSEILHKIIGDPYFAFVGGCQESILQESQGKALRVLIGKIASSDEAGAEALRCQLLRLLDPVASAEAGNMETAKTISKLGRAGAVEQLVASISDTFLPGQQAHRARAELATIVQEAAELSWSIWTRKSRIEILTWPAPALWDSEARDVQPYHSQSTVYALHPLNNKDVDDDAAAMDGCMPLLMWSPLVAAFGNADGMDYDQRVIIKKAVVWMGSE